MQRENEKKTDSQEVIMYEAVTSTTKGVSYLEKETAQSIKLKI